MITLSVKDFDKAIKVIESNLKTVPTFVYSILNNYINGIVYVDSKNVETLLIGTESGIYFIAGEEDNHQFNDFLFELYCNRKSEGLRFTLFSASENWDCVINVLFKDKLKQRGWYTFTYDHKKQFQDESPLASEYSIKRIDEELINSSSEYNGNYYKEYWGSVSNFIEKGFGYCILHKGRVVSECTSIFSSLQFSEMDIETHEDYRGQGLAAINAKAFINHCLENNIMPHWDCDILNNASIKLAGKLGFRQPNKYSIFIKNS
ncbi:GNAT family N-acetyltransferase [Viridibacillus sp. FSL H8-0123]|uniref:GNAT family N-acetyltransferase n=1 Tax=Viridibacillus sp. FSL H8-0123 TaxID=1928922 RepID=UPI00096FBF15|nr:GNAT family N-acetyltransferase [Viridibacillus sp. FSL H8-0123]OMC83306.1 GNAT family N-acetyltransferase [Viridibacillus sp. FSL H8-0123]